MICVTIFISIAVIIIITLVRYLHKDYAILSLCRRIKTLDGSPIEQSVAIAQGTTIFGNTFDLISMNAEQLFYYSRITADKLKRSYIEYIIGSPIYNVIDAADAELILNDSTLITKGIIYKFLQPFLKTGLLTSSDKKWHARRKLLTPAFHFNILSQFMDIFKQESKKFVKLLEVRSLESKEHMISLSELIPRFTLNNICETALGVRLDERLDGDEYRHNLDKVEASFVKRVVNPLLISDTIYNIFSEGKRDKKYFKILHAFSSDIIEKRRKVLQEELRTGNKEENESEFINRKQRYAMLDTMLNAEKDGLIDHAGICEEVDTFMFEGFDTTSMNLIFGLMNLSLYPEMQQKCYDEINELITDDDLTNLSITELNNLKYLECFIKETQRLYPSVPVILRECVRDTALANNLLLPKGTQIAVHIFDIHRNAKHYENPEAFQPERFSTENTEQRHPFAFIPFSAGQRNCIGQKFAMLEIKTLLVYILKNFKLLPVTDPKSFRFLAGILIRSRSDVKIRLQIRDKPNEK